jgi:hypothetical protein
MTHILKSFQGSYKIRFGSQTELFPTRIEPGFTLLIGTDPRNAPESDGIRVGVAILDQDNQRILPPEGQPPAYAYLVGGTLNGSTYWTDPLNEKPVLLTYQISLLTMRLEGGDLFRSPTLTISLGDPQNAGVWGAEDTGGGGPGIAGG